MARVSLAVCLLVLVAAASGAQAWSMFNSKSFSVSTGDTLSHIREFLGITGDDDSSITPARVLHKISDFIKSYIPLHQLMASREEFAKVKQDQPDVPGPEFRWIPKYVGAGMVESTVTLASAPCFQQTTLKVSDFSATGATLTFTVSNPTSLMCWDWYLIGTTENVQIVSFFSHGDHVVNWQFKSTVKPSELNDIKRNGFRVFRFTDNQLTTLYQVWETVELFLPALTNKAVPDSCEQQNVNFLKTTVQIELQRRNTTVVPLDESLVKNGDMFAILRLDGLDPMLAWAMGAHSGHTVVAIRPPGQNGLVLCESTTNSSYWPTNGVQCTPYQQWVQQAIAASQNVVYLPLKPEISAKFDATKAWEFFKQHEGNNYGYYNLLWAWQDNIGNYMFPLSPEFHSLLPAWAGKIYKPVADLLWNQAFNIRVGTQGLDTPDVYDAAYTKKNWGFRELHWAEEQDEWLYDLPKNDGTMTKARSMVCNVFVCAMWKASGMFDDQPNFNCAETTNWDVETLAIYDTNFQRPQSCVDADPTLPYCQISGNWRLEIPFYNTRWPIPQDAFANCPRGDAPLYNKPYPC